MNAIRTLRWACLALIAAQGMMGERVPAQATSFPVTAELPTSRELARYGLERAWWSQATLNPKRDKVKYMVLDEENVYLQSSGGTVTAYDADSGRRLWAVQLGNRDEPVFPGVSNEKHFLVVNGMSLYCIERFGGQVLWELTLPTMPSVGPSVDDDHIYVGTLDGSVYSFELRKLDELYRKGLLPRWSFEAMRWRYRTGNEITTKAHSNGLVVIFASRDGSLYAVEASERKLRWQFETNAPISASLATTEDSVIAASEDYYVYRLDRRNGRPHWEFASGYPIRKGPVVIEEDLFILPDNGELFNLDLQTGREKWSRPGVTNLLAASKRVLFGSDATGNVVLLQRSTGRPFGTLPLRPFSVRAQNDRTDRLFVATESGLVLCLRELGAEFGRFHRHPERSPIVPIVEPDEPTPPAPKPE
jgi:outer membrane protein assembly factor BamB